MLQAAAKRVTPAVDPQRFRRFLTGFELWLDATGDRIRIHAPLTHS